MGGGLEAFNYLPEVHVRRHGPAGYADYKSYRDWLRDEFWFRCVYCCKREQWDLVAGSWDIDHFIPQNIRPERKLEYENLVYVCHTCNLIKSKKLVPDPTEVAFGLCVVVREDGSMDALNLDGQTLIDELKLNNDDHKKYRRLIISTIRSLALHDRVTYRLWMGYPENLPDLRGLRPPSGNSKPDGVVESCHARKMRGELPDTY